MTQNNKHINDEDFRRYMEGEMTPAERNLFERELQKDPFETEAIEGFEAVSAVNMKQDLQELQEKITAKKRKNTHRYWAAAATILLLVTAGIIWVELGKMNSVPKMAEIKSEQKQEEIIENLAAKKETIVDDKISQPQTSNTIATRKKHVETDIALTPQKQSLPATPANIIEEEETAELEIAEKEPEMKATVAVPKTRKIAKQADSNHNIDNSLAKVKSNEVREKKGKYISGKVISATDSYPLSGVVLTEKGTENGIVSDSSGNFRINLQDNANPTIVASFIGMETSEFQPLNDSNNLIKLEPSEIALDEVVAVGYATQRKKSLTSKVSTVPEVKANSEPTPLCGMPDFKQYINNEAILPASYSEKRIAIKLNLFLNQKGEIIKIENRNNADSTLVEKAKAIIMNGSEWVPEFKDGKNIASEIEMKIIFRKKN